MKIKNFENICFALVISAFLTPFFGDDILKFTSRASSSPQDFLTLVGVYVGLFGLISVYFLGFRWIISIKKREPKHKF